MFSEDREIALLSRLHTLLQYGITSGLELSQMALLDVTLDSEIERRQWSIRYLQEGRLRAYVEIAHDVLHGEFFVLYPNGKLWIRGAYRNNSLVEESMKIFKPDGKLVKPKPPPNNVLPFKMKKKK